MMEQVGRIELRGLRNGNPLGAHCPSLPAIFYGAGIRYRAGILTLAKLCASILTLPAFNTYYTTQWCFI